MVDTIEPNDLLNQTYVENIMNTIVTEVPVMKRRRSSSCSSSSSLSSYSSSSSSSSEGEIEDFSSINNSRRYSSDSSDESEAEQEVILPFHRRQMEEMILDKITNQLEPEKLPSILTIISRKQEEEVEEVEIDLSRLDQDQLKRILSYVDACLKEKQGGPKVKLSDYTVEPVKQQQQTEPSASISKRQRRRNNNRRKSIVEEGHTVSGFATPTRLSSTQGPISMSALTLLEQQELKSSSTKKDQVKRKRAPAKKKNKDASVHMSITNSNPFKDSIASTKPKRKSAIHKRRLLEEMLQHSDDDDTEDEQETDDNGSGIILYGNERMDLAVTQNETIVHQSIQASSYSIATSNQENTHEQQVQEEAIEEEEDDELIDIMM